MVSPTGIQATKITAEQSTPKLAAVESDSEKIDKIQSLLGLSEAYDSIKETFKSGGLLSDNEIANLKEAIRILKSLKSQHSAEASDIRSFILNGLTRSLANANSKSPGTMEYIFDYRELLSDLLMYAFSTDTKLGSDLLNVIETKLAAGADWYGDSFNISANVFYPRTNTLSYKDFLKTYRAFEKIQNNFYNGEFTVDTFKIDRVEKLEKIRKLNPFLESTQSNPAAVFEAKNYKATLAGDAMTFLLRVKNIAPEYLNIIIEHVLEKIQNGIDAAVKEPTTITELREIRKNKTDIRRYLSDMQLLSNFFNDNFDRKFLDANKYGVLISQLNAITNQSEAEFAKQAKGGMSQPIELAPGLTMEGDPEKGTAWVMIDLGAGKAAHRRVNTYPTGKTVEQTVTEANPFPLSKGKEIFAATISTSHFLPYDTYVEGQNLIGHSARPYIKAGAVFNALPGDGANGRLDDYLDQYAIVIKKDGSFSIQTVKSALQMNNVGRLVRDNKGDPVAKSDVSDVIIGTHVEKPNSELSINEALQPSTNIAVQYNGKIHLFQSSHSTIMTIADIQQKLGIPFDAEAGIDFQIAILDPGRSLMLNIAKITENGVAANEALELIGFRAIRNGAINSGDTHLPNPGTLTFFFEQK